AFRGLQRYARDAGRPAGGAAARHLGPAGCGDDALHYSEIDVDLEPSVRSKAEIVADIRQRLAVLPLSVNIGQPISHRLDHLLSGVRAEIAVKVFGDSLDTLRTVAEDLRQRLANVPGLVDLQVEKQALTPQLEIRVDYRRAALYGVQPAAVVDQLSRLSNGRIVSRVADGYRRFDVTMRLPQYMRTTQGARRSPHRDPGWMDTGKPGCGCQGNRRPQSDTAGKQPPPGRRLRQYRIGRQSHQGRCCHSPG